MLLSFSYFYVYFSKFSFFYRFCICIFLEKVILLTVAERGVYISGETTIKAKTPLDDYTKRMTWLEWIPMETCHYFETPNKGKDHNSSFSMQWAT